MVADGRCSSWMIYFLKKWASVLSNWKDRAMMIGRG